MTDNGQKKILLMKIGAVVLVIFLLLLWILNLKNVWRLNNESAAVTEADSAWLAIRNDINRTMSVARGQLNQVTERKQVEMRDGQNFLVQLMTVAQRNAATIATSSATSTPIRPVATTTPVLDNKNCPQWIDCMPGPDRREPCRVPAGCEGVTQIAY